MSHADEKISMLEETQFNATRNQEGYKEEAMSLKQTLNTILQEKGAEEEWLSKHLKQVLTENEKLSEQLKAIYCEKEQINEQLILND